MKLKQYLSDLLSEGELEQLICSYDVIGDIAITIIPESLEGKESIIGQAILDSNRKIRVVTKRAGFYSGEYRTIPLQVIAGEERKETEVREFGLRLRLNVETVYYSIRSGNERKRVASLVAKGESVLVLFSGVAPYPLVISKYSKAEHIVGIEKNPEAHGYAMGNLELNKKCNNIELMCGDAEVILSLIKRKFDRIAMPLPARGEVFLPSAIKSLRPGGWLHFYDFQQRGQFQKATNKIVTSCSTMNRSLVESDVTTCGHCAPRTHRVCVDARIA